MTTNTDLHVAMPELPVVAYINHKACMPPSLDNWATAGTLNSEPLVRLSDARAAIQQAAVPEGLISVPRALAFKTWHFLAQDCTPCAMTDCQIDGKNAGVEPLVAKWASITGAASTAPPKQQPALGGGEGGGVQAWQPIETAPKDGTEILLYSPPIKDFSVKYKTRRIAWWVTGRTDADGYWGTEVFFDGRSIVQHVHNASHWMHLQPPPTHRPSAPTGQINPDSAGQGMEGGE